MKLINLVHASQIFKLIPDWEEMTIEATVTTTLPPDFEFPKKHLTKLANMGWTLKDGVLSVGEKKAAKRTPKSNG